MIQDLKSNNVEVVLFKITKLIDFKLWTIKSHILL